jgi:hypothetical protein
MFELKRITVCLGVAATLVVGCKAKEPAVDTATSAGAVAPATTPTTEATIRVADIDMGRSIKADKSIDDNTDDFKPTDTIYASVQTNGIATNTPLTARWTFQDGQVVDEKTETLTTTGDTKTEFHISKPGGLPEGKYTVHVLVDGKEVQTKDITVKK